MKRMRQVLGLLRLGREKVRGRPCGMYVGLTGLCNLGDALMYPLSKKLFQPAQLFDYYPTGDTVRDSLTSAFDFGILGGGTLINGQVFGPCLQRILDRDVPCIAFGTGVKDPAFWCDVSGYNQSLTEWADILNSFALIGVRGPQGAKALSRMGVKSPISVIGDPSLSLTPLETHAPQPKRLGINFGQAIGPVLGDAEEQVRDGLERCIGHLQKSGWHITLFVVRPEDYSTCTSLLAGSGSNVATCEVCTEYVHARRYIEAVAHCTVFVGYKLHATALAMVAGVPSVMVAYRPKCEDFMESLGCLQWTVRPTDVHAPLLVDLVEELATNRARLSSQIHDACLSYKERQAEFVCHVRERLRIID